MKSFWSSGILLAALLFVHCYAGAIEGNEVANEEEVHDAVEVTDVKQVKSSGDIATENRQRVLNKIFHGYDPRNYPTNGTLLFGISLNRFDVDEERSTADADIWIRSAWQDNRLSWNPAEFGGDDSPIRLPATEVWRPDISLYNTAEPRENMNCRDTNVLVYPSGKVLWVPPCHVKANCNMTLDRSPYAEQTCTFKFGSWTFDGFTQDIQFYKNETKADMSYYSDLSEWEVTGTSATRLAKYYSCCTEPYVTIDIDVTFHRKGIHAAGKTCQA